MSLYIDLTEFLRNPMTTGIQRIEREICRYMAPGTAIPLRLCSGRYFALSPLLIQAIGKHFSDSSESAIAEIRRLGASANGSTITISSDDVILTPEVFHEPERVAFFREMRQEELNCYRFIVYDLIPVTHPEYFHHHWLQGTFGYFQIIRRASSCGFISEHTRDVYYGRLKRTDARGGVVLPLGSDALGPRPERLSLNRPLTFTVVSTIEERKNHELILEAFQPLLRQIPGLTLAFVGKMGWVNTLFAQRVRAFASDESSGFQFHPATDDATLRRHIERSRATIYVSAAEGYGLPPVESLWCGTPVIACSTIPSLQRLGSAGIHYVEPLNVTGLRRAILAFIDSEYANRKARETIQLNLPTWKHFTQEVLHWCGGEAPKSRTEIPCR